MKNKEEIKYAEDYPAGCPPSEAEQLEDQLLLRLVPNNPVGPDDFMSHHALGKPKPKKVPAWSWASCSMFKDSAEGQLRLKGLRGLPTLKKCKFVAKVQVGPDAGVAKVEEDDHVHFWRYISFEPWQSIKEMVEVA